MQYITGIHALNLPCRLATSGDWHMSGIQWDYPTIRESRGTVWGEYGIELQRSIPEHEESFAVANHIRALLDLIQDGSFAIAHGMKKDFLCNDAYTKEVFQQIHKLRDSERWIDIDCFMHKEYGREWRIWRNSMAGVMNISM